MRINNHSALMKNWTYCSLYARKPDLFEMDHLQCETGLLHTEDDRENFNIYYYFAADYLVGWYWRGWEL
jgi:hypothetical protein